MSSIINTYNLYNLDARKLEIKYTKKIDEPLIWNFNDDTAPTDFKISKGTSTESGTYNLVDQQAQITVKTTSDAAQRLGSVNIHLPNSTTATSEELNFEIQFCEEDGEYCQVGLGIGSLSNLKWQTERDSRSYTEYKKNSGSSMGSVRYLKSDYNSFLFYLGRRDHFGYTLAGEQHTLSEESDLPANEWLSVNFKINFKKAKIDSYTIANKKGDIYFEGENISFIPTANNIMSLDGITFFNNVIGNNTGGTVLVDNISVTIHEDPLDNVLYAVPTGTNTADLYIYNSDKSQFYQVGGVDKFVKSAVIDDDNLVLTLESSDIPVTVSLASIIGDVDSAALTALENKIEGVNQITGSLSELIEIEALERKSADNLLQSSIADIENKIDANANSVQDGISTQKLTVAEVDNSYGLQVTENDFQLFKDIDDSGVTDCAISINNENKEMEIRGLNITIDGNAGTTNTKNVTLLSRVTIQNDDSDAGLQIGNTAKIYDGNILLGYFNDATYSGKIDCGQLEGSDDKQAITFYGPGSESKQYIRLNKEPKNGITIASDKFAVECGGNEMIQSSNDSVKLRSSSGYNSVTVESGQTKICGDVNLKDIANNCKSLPTDVTQEETNFIEGNLQTTLINLYRQNKEQKEEFETLSQEALGNISDLTTNLENTSNQMDDIFNYSTTPVRVGTWVDGTPIWRVAFDKDLTIADYYDSSTKELIIPLKDCLASGAFVKNNDKVFYIQTLGNLKVTNPDIVDDLSLTLQVTDWIRENFATDLTTIYNGIWGWIEFATPEDNLA